MLKFSSHDGLIVASRWAQETDAVIATDGSLNDAGVTTIRKYRLHPLLIRVYASLAAC